MMRLSTKGRYGTRLMLELAIYYKKGPVLLKDIAAREEISSGYLEHIISRLKAARLVHSARGAHGGYFLSKSPQDINLKQIIEALEGPLAPVQCVDKPKICSRMAYCVTRDIWEELKEKVEDTLKNVTLGDMIKRQKEKAPAVCKALRF